MKTKGIAKRPAANSKPLLTGEPAQSPKKERSALAVENAAKKAARERGQRARACTLHRYPVPTKMGWLTLTRTSENVTEALKRAIALSKSASDFDEWFCVFLDSLDGTDEKTYSPEYMESALRDDLWVGHLDWPNDADYDWESYDVANKLKEWERVARNCSELLLAAQQLKLTFTATVVARVIGEIIAFRLEYRDFAAPRIVSEGLLNLKQGKPYKTGSAKKSDTLIEVSAAYYTFVSNGILDPSQAEVGAYLAGKGISMSPSRLSKAFDTLRLKSKAGDARRAQSDAGKRRRGKA